METDYEETASFDLVQLENAPLLRDALRGAQGEMGDPRAVEPGDGGVNGSEPSG